MKTATHLYDYKLSFSPYQNAVRATSIKNAKKIILECHKNADEKHIQFITKRK